MFKRKKKGDFKSNTRTPASPPPPESFEDELRAFWNNRNLKSLFKDLPRLAQRIVVFGKLRGSESQTNSQTDASIPTNTSNLNLQEFVVYINTQSVVPGKAANWPDSYIIRKLRVFKNGNVILEFLDDNEDSVTCRCESSQIIGVTDSTRYFIVMNVYIKGQEESHKVGFAFYSREEAKKFKDFVYEESKQHIPSGTDTDPPFPVDTEPDTVSQEPEGFIEEEELDKVNDLANKLINEAKHSRLELNKVRDTLTHKVSQCGTGYIVTKEEKQRMSIPSDLQTKDLPIMLGLKRVIKSIAKEIETDTHYQAICAELDKPDHETYDGDKEVWTDSIFQNTIGIDSNTARLLKSITQGVIHIASYHIKTKLKSDVITSDVRGPEGWQILIIFANDVIYVTHRRRERSLESLGPTKQFWFEYMVNMVFDQKLGDLTSATLRISNIGYGDNIEDDYKDMISKLFCRGHLIIA